MPAITRLDLRQIAEEKIDDARHLLAVGRSSNAYYLAGYAVEIGLKACIARQFASDAIPDRKFVNDIHVHDLPKLAGLAGLGVELQALKVSNPLFGANWTIVVEWSPEVRYRTVDAASAGSMVAAVDVGADGVLPWIRTRW